MVGEGPAGGQAAAAVRELAARPCAGTAEAGPRVGTGLGTPVLPQFTLTALQAAATALYSVLPEP